MAGEIKAAAALGHCGGSETDQLGGTVNSNNSPSKIVPQGGARLRRKGNRIEREIVERHHALDVYAERHPDSEAIRITMTTCAQALVVIASRARPRRGRSDGRFKARVDRRLLCRSHRPLLDAARVLLAEGQAPDTNLVVRHAGSDIDCLTTTVGAAARLTVEESGHGPVFRRQRIDPQRPVEAASVHSGGQEAISDRKSS